MNAPGGKREGRLEQQAREHADMRARLRAKTDTAVACLQELRVNAEGSGHFYKGLYLPPGVSKREVRLALKSEPPEGFK